VIREQIEETRSSLTEKLETLEGQIRGTVVEAKETVEDTIENVKSTVQDTVQTVKRTFDIEYQVEHHPWAMLGGSVVAGYLVGHFLNREQNGHVPAQEPPRAEPAPLGFRSTEAAKPGVVSRILHQFHDEIEQVKEMAIGATMGFLRDLVKQSIPQLAPQIDKVMNSATSKMGGEPIRQTMVEPQSGGDSPGTQPGNRPHSAMTY
jgi:ElaB/YqjD/DUF883 family membrane-anchored ribosome-binding protein